MPANEVQIPVSLDVQFGATQQAKLKKQIETATNNINIRVNDIKAGNGTGSLADLGQQQQKLAGLTKAFDQITAASARSSAKIADITKATKEADGAMGSFGARTGFAAARLAAYLIPATAVFNITRAIGIAAKDITEFSTDVTKLTQILNGNREAAQKLSEEVLKIGQSYGVSGKELLRVSTSLAQGGLRFKNPQDIINTTNELAKTKLVGTFDDITESTQGLITVLNQFNLSAGKSGEVLATVNNIAKDFAVSSDDIFKGISQSSGAFQLAGGNFKQLAVLVGGLRGLTGLPTQEIGSELNNFLQKSFQPETKLRLDQLSGGVSRQGNIFNTLQAVAQNTRGQNTQQLGATLRDLSDTRGNKTLITLIQDLQKANEGGSQLVNKLNGLDGSIGQFNRDAQEGLKTIDAQLQSIGTSFQAVFEKLSQDKGIQNLVEDFAILAKSAAYALDKVAPFIPILVQLGALKIGASLFNGLSNGNILGGATRFLSRGNLNQNTALPATIISPLTGSPIERDSNQALIEKNFVAAIRENTKIPNYSGAISQRATAQSINQQFLQQRAQIQGLVTRDATTGRFQSIGSNAPMDPRGYIFPKQRYYYEDPNVSKIPMVPGINEQAFPAVAKLFRPGEIYGGPKDIANTPESVNLVNSLRAGYSGTPTSFVRDRLDFQRNQALIARRSQLPIIGNSPQALGSGSVDQRALLGGILSIGQEKTPIVQNIEKLNYQITQYTSRLRAGIITQEEAETATKALAAERRQAKIALAKLEAEELRLATQLEESSIGGLPQIPGVGPSIRQNVGRDLSRLGIGSVPGALKAAAPILLSIAGQQINESLKSQNQGISIGGRLSGDFSGITAQNNINNILGEAASGGGTGALIGSFVPGIGTAVGGAVGAGIGGLHATFATNPQATQNQLLDIAASNTGIEGSAPALQKLLENRTDSVRSTVQGFLSTDQGRQIQGNFRNQALGIAADIGRNNRGLSVGQIEGQTRQQLVGQLASQFEQEGESKKRALFEAQGIVSETLLSSVKEIQDVARSARTLKINEDKLADAFATTKDGIVAFVTGFKDRSRELGRGSLNLAAGLQISQQATGLAFGKQTGFSLSESFPQALTENLFRGIRSSGTDSRDVTRAIGQFSGGILNGNEQRTFGDLGAIQNFLGQANRQIVGGLAQVPLNASNLTAGTDAAQRIFGDLVRNSGPLLQTAGGQDKFQQVRTQFSESLSTPEGLKSFNTDRETFINKFFNDQINLTGDFLARATERVKEFNLRVEESLQPLERLSQAQAIFNQNTTQAFGIRLQQAQRGPNVGATPFEILGGLGGVNSSFTPSLLSGGLLSSATSRLNKAQAAAAGLNPNLVQNGQAVGGLDQTTFNKVSSVLQENISAQTEYNRVVNESALALQGLKAEFELASRTLEGISKSEQGIGGLDTAGQFGFRRNIGLAQNVFGGALGGLAGSGILNAQQIGNNPAAFNQFAKQIGNTPSGIFNQLVGGLQQAGNTLLPSGITGSDAASLLLQGRGQNIIGGTALAGPTNKKVGELQTTTKKDFSAIVTLEGAQGDSLNSINSNLKTIVDILNGKTKTGSGGPVQAGGVPITLNTNFKFDGNINITGLEDAGKDVRTRGAVIFVLEEFTKQLNQSDPTQADTAAAMKKAIDIVRNNGSKK